MDYNAIFLAQYAEAKEQVKTAINNRLYGVLNAIADGFMNNARLAFNQD